MENQIKQFKKIMQDEGLDEIVIKSFMDYYRQLLHGSTGKLTESEIAPPGSDKIEKRSDLEDYEKPPYEQLAIVKLNGGLGTSMGLNKVKSLLQVKNGNNFLDIIAKQTKYLRNKTQEQIPLLFMDSFNTRSDTLQYLEEYPDLPTKDLPLDFLQNKFPKIRQDNLGPLQMKDNKLNWNPPGHGEIYMTMQLTGILDKLLDKGIKYLFISNSDNLGAIVDRNIFGFFVENNIPFLMEVCRRTEMDKKGGHLAETKDGQLVLREIAQCPDNELQFFQNINHYKYFNTNNLWVNLIYLKKKLEENDGRLPLSLIINPKVVNGVKVYQLESAMGAAISIFEGSRAILVGKDRLVPVKKTNDLLAVRSDAYVLDDYYKLVLNNTLNTPPNIELIPKFYKTLQQFDEHFISIPSLKNCKALQVNREVYFRNNVKIKGKVEINDSLKLEDEILEDVKL